MVTTFWYYSFPIRIYLLATFLAFIEVDALVPFYLGSFLLLGQLEVLGIFKVLHLYHCRCRSCIWVCWSYCCWWFIQYLVMVWCHCTLATLQSPPNLTPTLLCRTVKKDSNEDCSQAQGSHWCHSIYMQWEKIKFRPPVIQSTIVFFRFRIVQYSLQK